MNSNAITRYSLGGYSSEMGVADRDNQILLGTVAAVNKRGTRPGVPSPLFCHSPLMLHLVDTKLVTNDAHSNQLNSNRP